MARLSIMNPQLPNMSQAIPNVIRLEKLTKDYSMGQEKVRALKGISFALNQGDYLAIIGSSGSGKSTLLNILGCLDSPTGGEYLLDGRNVAHYDDPGLSAIRREKLGYIFQSFNLIASLSVLENIEVPLYYMGWHERRSRDRARELADLVGLGDRCSHRPNQLSGGQRQRVAIARALANNPRMILADEPTGNLDLKTSGEIMAILDRLVNEEKRTVILVTHELEVAGHARRVIRLSDGEIVEDRAGKV